MPLTLQGAERREGICGESCKTVSIVTLTEGNSRDQERVSFIATLLYWKPSLLLLLQTRWVVGGGE